MAFEFNFGDDEPTLKSAVFQALGYASTCWDSMSHTGVFKSDDATEAGNKLVQFIKDQRPVPEMAAPPRIELRSEIKVALNRNSAENGSNTPDHVLADYLLACLDAFDTAAMNRDRWWGADHSFKLIP